MVPRASGVERTERGGSLGAEGARSGGMNWSKVALLAVMYLAVIGLLSEYGRYALATKAGWKRLLAPCVVVLTHSVNLGRDVCQIHGPTMIDFKTAHYRNS